MRSVADITKYKRDLFKKFEHVISLGQWQKARNLVKKAIVDDEEYMVKIMMNHYREKVCKICLGAGTTVEGSFESQIIEKCPCQKN